MSWFRAKYGCFLGGLIFCMALIGCHENSDVDGSLEQDSFPDAIAEGLSFPVRPDTSLVNLENESLTDSSEISVETAPLDLCRSTMEFYSKISCVIDIYLEQNKKKMPYTAERLPAQMFCDIETNEHTGRRMLPVKLGSYLDELLFVTDQWIFIDSVSLRTYEWDIVEDKFSEFHFSNTSR